MIRTRGEESSSKEFSGSSHKGAARASLACTSSSASRMPLADVIVNLPIGQLNGRIEYSKRNVTFYAFQSVPYGKAPVGDLRFADPQAAGGWQGIFDATRLDGPVCYPGGSAHDHQSEDCLRLNIYTPTYPNQNDNLPVMVYIHGGGFLSGNSNFYGAGPHYLMEAGIVVVTILYRLGPFGFLATGDTEVPGNMGLKDQTLALQWVRDYIKYFGGDPTKVTLNGQSAGAASVAYHVLSPKSAGLFRAAIAESGSSLCTWAYNRNHVEQVYNLANNCGGNFHPESNSTHEVVQFLRTVPAETLRAGTTHLPWNRANQGWLHGFSFTPVIEPDYSNAFLSQRMYDVISSGSAHKIPYILGINSEEMLAEVKDLNGLNWNAKSMDNNLSYAVPNNMHLSNWDALNEAGEALRQIYTSGTFQSNLANAVKFYSDAAFTHFIIHHAKLQSQFSDVYFYQFSYNGTLGGSSYYIDGAERVGHAKELPYIWVWGNHSNLNSYPSADVLASDRLRGLFTNFVKYLNPTPSQDQLFQNITWPKLNISNPRYLNFNENLSIESSPKSGSYFGWVNAYEIHAIKPYDSY